MVKPVGVIGAGSFGMTVAKLLTENCDVIVFSRRQELVDKLNTTHEHLGVLFSEKLKATSDIEYLCSSCDVIFPVVPSSSFRETLQALSKYLHPYHILIHGTKGLDTPKIDINPNALLRKKDIYTMSEVILEETCVLRVGGMSGPNLAKEILAGKPAACVIASEFDEVVKIGQQVLGSKNFTVFGSNDIKGAELAGAYKNIVALASGMLAGLDLGKNMEALLITRGLNEMIQFGISLGLSGQAFLGTAGIGDMIATATSSNSRNYAFGYRFAKGESYDQIMQTTDEVVEGVRTLKIIYQLAKNEHIIMPITIMLYKVVFEGLEMRRAITHLMSFPDASDFDFNISKD